METLELQKKANEIVDMIDKKLNINHDENVILIHLVEEFGELARQYNNKNVRVLPEDKSNLEEEMADVMILLMKFGTIKDINVENAIINKINKLKQRHKL